MFGDDGNDKLFGAPGDDGMAGGAGADEHYGGPGNDFIDAAEFDPVNAPDLVNGGDGYDVCIVSENDTVVNCERIEVVPNPEPVGATDTR